METPIKPYCTNRLALPGGSPSVASAAPRTAIPAIIATTISRRCRAKRQPETMRRRAHPSFLGDTVPESSAASPIPALLAASVDSVQLKFIVVSFLASPCPNAFASGCWQTTYPRGVCRGVGQKVERGVDNRKEAWLGRALSP